MHNLGKRLRKVLATWQTFACGPEQLTTSSPLVWNIHERPGRSCRPMWELERYGEIKTEIEWFVESKVLFLHPSNFWQISQSCQRIQYLLPVFCLCTLFLNSLRSLSSEQMVKCSFWSSFQVSRVFWLSHESQTCSGCLKTQSVYKCRAWIGNMYSDAFYSYRGFFCYLGYDGLALFKYARARFINCL